VFEVGRENEKIFFLVFIIFSSVKVKASYVSW
jgi:hypothetical protein